MFTGLACQKPGSLTLADLHTTERKTAGEKLFGKFIARNTLEFLEAIETAPQ